MTEPLYDEVAFVILANELKDATNHYMAGAHVSLRALDSLNVLAPEIKSELLSALAARSYAEAETYRLQLRFDATVKILRRRLRQWRDRSCKVPTKSV